jgi:hypothetical protein
MLGDDQHNRENVSKISHNQSLKMSEWFDSQKKRSTTSVSS